MSYQSKQVFKNDRINAVIDYIFENLIIAFPPPVEDGTAYTVYGRMILSGKAAAILQGESDSPVNNITLQTDKLEFYLWCVKNLPRIFNCRKIAFKNQLLLYPNDFFIEIWYTPTIEDDVDSGLKISVVDTIFVQQIAYIPTETL